MLMDTLLIPRLILPYLDRCITHASILNKRAQDFGSLLNEAAGVYMCMMCVCMCDYFISVNMCMYVYYVCILYIVKIINEDMYVYSIYFINYYPHT